MFRTEVVIDSERYNLDSVGGPAFQHYTEPAMVRQPAIVGSSRPAETTRPEILTLRWDDWSGGEGQKFLDTRDDSSGTLYYQSTGPVDVGTPGQVTLGFSLSESLDVGDLGGTDRGPHLVVANGNPWVFFSPTGAASYDGKVYTSSWSAADTRAAAAILGPPSVYGNFIFTTAGDQILRTDATDTTVAFTVVQWVASAGSTPVAANSRLYYVTTSGGNTLINRVDLNGTPPMTLTTLYTALGIGGPRATAHIGSDVFLISAVSGEEPRLHMLQDEVGFERFRFPIGFRLRQERSDEMETLNDVLFVGGYFSGATGEPDTPALFYVTADAFGEVAQIRSGTSDRISTLAPASSNSLLIGTTEGQIYRYNMETGAVSEYISGSAAGHQINSLAYVDGTFWVATHNSGGTASKVYKSTPSGSGKYVSESTIQGSQWDFGLPEEVKILQEVEVQTESLPAGASVELQFVLDGSTITTDAAGATMAHSSGTRSTFTVSNASTERTFRFIRPDVVLKTSNTANTPTVFNVTMKALTTGVVEFFKVRVNLSDDDASSRLPNKQESGRAKITRIRTLISNASSNSGGVSKLFSFQEWYTQPAELPPTSAPTTHVVQLVDGRIIGEDQGRAVGELTLKKVG